VQTGDKELINVISEKSPETLIWGACKTYSGKLEGRNLLGQVLMQIRMAVKSGNLYKNWFSSNFYLVQNPQLLPTLSLLENNNGLETKLQLD